MLSQGFTYLDDPRFLLSMDYATTYNFLGRKVKGYESPRCILTFEAAHALITLQDELDAEKTGYRLKIFDAYRPQMATEDFVVWAEDPDDTRMEKIFYPGIAKPELFKLGYIAKQRSSHTRGSTVDLTLTELKDSEQGAWVELDMGTPFDFFNEKSHTLAANISEVAKKNRLFLKEKMEKCGFENYKFEWWHYTLKNEPFAETYFDFPVK